MKKVVRKIAGKLGFDIVSKSESLKEYDEFIDIYNECQPYTMTTIERMFSLYKAVEYVVKNNIPGDLYECGVWRGGSSMMIAKTLQKFNCNDRNLYLFDTFEGMTEPTEVDKDATGTTAKEYLDNFRKKDADFAWCDASIEDVQNNMKLTGYPAERIFYIKGKVEDTLPSFEVKNDIAVLRLDTDWYESTKVEMNYLYPKLVVAGVLIIDDYGYWEGARKAIDEYLEQHKIKMLLNRIDITGRIAVKTM